MLATLVGFTGLGTAFVLQPTPDITQTPIVQYSPAESLTEGPQCGDGQPTAPEGCVWALACDE